MAHELLVAGSRYFDLTVTGVSYVVTSKRGKKERYYECLCVCGNTTKARKVDLKSGNSKSCGCRAAKAAKIRLTKHGMSKTKIYAAWLNMIRRCNDPKNNRYKIYGARGISVCERWMSFENFYSDVGAIPFTGATLDRVDSNLGYYPENVKWASQLEQQRNRTNNVLFTYEGESLTAGEWADRLGVNRQTMASRLLLRGWSIERALSQPIREGGNRRNV